MKNFNNDFKNNISIFIKKFRISRNLSLRDFSNAINISFKTVSKWEMENFFQR
ncbi:MAG: helix-turn-helix transcriptional regulator [Lactobacillaceae bacterium]|nr:helix-turn-helix transcriptional regulator [Lactobacillaceae bacterium]